MIPYLSYCSERFYCSSPCAYCFSVEPKSIKKNRKRPETHEASPSCPPNNISVFDSVGGRGRGRTGEKEEQRTQGADALTLRNFGGRTPTGKSYQGNRSVTNSSSYTGLIVTRCGRFECRTLCELHVWLSETNVCDIMWYVYNTVCDVLRVLWCERCVCVCVWCVRCVLDSRAK